MPIKSGAKYIRIFVIYEAFFVTLEKTLIAQSVNLLINLIISISVCPFRSFGDALKEEAAATIAEQYDDGGVLRTPIVTT